MQQNRRTEGDCSGSPVRSATEMAIDFNTESLPMSPLANHAIVCLQSPSK